MPADRSPSDAAPPPARTDATGAVPLALRAGAADELRRRLIWLTLARLAVALFLLTILLAFGSGAGTGSATARGVLGVVVSIFVVSIAYSLALSRGRDLRTLAIVQIALDLAAWTALVYLTGGPVSPMSFFFGLSALTAALVLGESAARITAVIAIAIYGALAIAMTNGLIAPLGDQTRRPQPSGPELAFQLIITVIGILSVTGLAGSLASRISRAGGALARAEESRAALAALYEDVLRSIPVALITCTAEGIIDSANAGATLLLATPAKDLLGTSVTQWLPFIPSDAFQPGAASRDGDETLAALPAQPRVAYHAAALYDRAGRARGGLVVIEDRSHAESLREAVQRAERLAVLGRLAAGMAHEIRNPLGAISGCVELVREANALTDEDRQLLSTVLREVQRLNDLVTDMLAFAKPRPPERARTDLSALARDVCALARTHDAKVPVNFVDTDGEPEVANVDAAQIRQVIWNLVRNAAQASPSGSIVEVALRGQASSVELVVADRGPGIRNEARDKLFDAFYSEHDRGTGLGLAIVKQIADAHAARIAVRDRAGGGTEFALILPRV